MNGRKIRLWPLSLGVAIFVIQIPFLLPEIDWIRHSALTTGTVVSLNAGGKHPQIEFTASNGEHISVPASSFFHFTKVGEQVTVRYDSRSPRIAYIDGVINIWGGFIIFGVAALASILEGLFGFGSKATSRDEG